ncbi:MAG TPA: hypothetical protein VD862_04875 [Candidatus Paceibacterota bacterium]|nr:hypothetical protein [Candidatus Paceibacterota bacterium]
MDKKKTKQILGALMMLSPFGGVYGIGVAEHGFMYTTAVFAAFIVAVTIAVSGAILVMKNQG